MPVEPVSYVMIGLIGFMVVLNLINYFEPKYDRWQAERRGRQTRQASVRISNLSPGFLKIASLLHGMVSQRNESLLELFTRIDALTLVYQGYPEFLVPGVEYSIPFSYTRLNQRQKVHFQTEVDYNRNVCAFNVKAMTNQTNEELLQFVSSLPVVQPVAAVGAM